MRQPVTPDNPFDRLARLYDWEHDPFGDDIAAYVAFAGRFGGPVLELACGTGRLLQPLAAAGFACTGIDRSPAMLARARARLGASGCRAELLEGSVEAPPLAGRQFRTILFPLDGLALLRERTAQLAALTAARKLVSHDGRLVLDVSNGNLRGGNEPVEDLLHHLTQPDPEHGRPITKWVVRRPDPATQVDELTFFYDELDPEGRVRRTVEHLRLRWFTRPEIELLLERAGWQPDELYGGYDLEPYGPASDRILVAARPA